MYNHAPENYKCPICLGVQGIENDDFYTNILNKIDTTVEERKEYAEKVKEKLQ